jgi:hypothetical protein
MKYDEYLKIINDSHDKIYSKLDENEIKLLHNYNKDANALHHSLYLLRNSDDYDFNDYRYYAEDIYRRFFVYKYKTSNKPKYYFV